MLTNIVFFPLVILASFQHYDICGAAAANVFVAELPQTPEDEPRNARYARGRRTSKKGVRFKCYSSENHTALNILTHFTFIHFTAELIHAIRIKCIAQGTTCWRRGLNRQAQYKKTDILTTWPICHSHSTCQSQLMRMCSHAWLWWAEKGQGWRWRMVCKRLKA